METADRKERSNELNNIQNDFLGLMEKFTEEYATFPETGILVKNLQDASDNIHKIQQKIAVNGFFANAEINNTEHE